MGLSVVNLSNVFKQGKTAFMHNEIQKGIDVVTEVNDNGKIKSYLLQDNFHLIRVKCFTNREI